MYTEGALGSPGLRSFHPKAFSSLLQGTHATVDYSDGRGGPCMTFFFPLSLSELMLRLHSNSVLFRGVPITKAPDTVMVDIFSQKNSLGKNSDLSLSWTLEAQLQSPPQGLSFVPVSHQCDLNSGLLQFLSTPCRHPANVPCVLFV